MRVVSAPWGRAVHSRRRPPPVRRRCTAFLDWLTASDKKRPCAQGGPRPPLVRDPPPVRRRQRTDRSGHGRPVLARAGGTRSASTACRRRSGARASTTTRCWKTRRRARSTSPPGCNGSSAIRARDRRREDKLAAVLRKARFWRRMRAARDERKTAIVAQPTAGRIRRGSSRVQMGRIGEVLPGHGAARHSRVASTRGILSKDTAGGRSTSYSLNEDSWLPGD